MIRLLTLLLISSVAFPLLSVGQCTLDTTFSGLYYSEFGDELPPARINAEYEAVIHIQVPADTGVLGLPPISIDSGVITDVSGLPTGLEYECDQPRCAYPGGTYGCVRVFGTPTDTTEIGKNDLILSIQVYTSLLSGPRDVEEFSIELEADFPAAIEDVAESTLSIATDQNPISWDGYLILQSSRVGKYRLVIYSLLGAKEALLVAETTGNEQRIGINQFDLSAGVYFATVEMEGQRQSVRFIVR